MLLAEVVGSVWSDRQVAQLDGHRLFVVRDTSDGRLHVAADLVGTGAGATVLVATDEAAQAISGEAGLDAAIVALVGGQRADAASSASGEGQ